MPAAPATVLALSRVFAGVDVHPASLPASAVLLVRRLPDPRPRALSAGSASAHPPAAWQQALHAAVDRAARHAARPAHGPISPSAEAVLFADEAELLACLARDYVNGTLAHCWWWQTLLRSIHAIDLDAVVRAWEERARHAPAAMAMLHRASAAVAFVRALTARQARAIFVAMAEAYELPILASPMSLAGPVVAVAGQRPPSLGRPDRDAGEARGAFAARLAEPDDGAPPWAFVHTARTVPRDLPLESHALVGLSLALWQAPLVCRSRAFAQSFHAWRRRHQEQARDAIVRAQARTEQPTHADSSHHDDDRPVETTRHQTGEAATSTDPVSTGDRLASRPGASSDAPVDAVPTPPIARVDVDRSSRADRIAAPIESIERRSAEVPGIVTPARGRIEGSTHGRSGDSSPIEPQPTDVVIRPIERTSRGEIPEEPISWIGQEPASVFTQIGGVLFLINAVRDVWPRLIDEPATCGLGPWTALAMIARELLRRRPDIDGDPLWGVLGELDGTADRPDVTTDANPFIVELATSLRLRLTAALGFDPGDDTEARLCARLLLRRGRLAYTATHVDLHMSMDQIDIAVRLAGLDANPGWVPALGRVVTFYFD